MRTRHFSLPFLLALACCTSGAAGWSSEVCGCADAWEGLAWSLKLPDSIRPEELTLPVVQAASERFIGKPLVLAELPNTGSTDSCAPSTKGATCAWRIWEKNGAYKGYVADFVVASGRIISVSVQERTWSATGGT